MNAKTMKVVLDSHERSTRAICQLKEMLSDSSTKLDRLKGLIGCGNLDGPSTEEAIKRMSFERTTLETNYKQHVELVNALATCPLPRDASESNQAYALRVGEALKDAKLQWEHDQLRIAQLETRESELNELHDTIESLLGFPMEPEEKYSEYLQRMAAEVAQLRTQLDAANRRLLNAQADNELLTGQRQIVEGELSLHQQVIARLMMQPGTDKVFDLDWNASARKVLIDARALCGDTAEANVVTKEPA